MENDSRSEERMNESDQRRAPICSKQRRGARTRIERETNVHKGETNWRCRRSGY